VRELQRRGVTRFEITSYLAHGVSTPKSPSIPERSTGDAEVVLINDDFTPMEFVVTVLREHFDLTLDAAVRIMLTIHSEGRAVCGRFAAGIAAEKVALVRAAARAEGHPLLCILE